MNFNLLKLLSGLLILFVIGLFSCEPKCGPFPNKYKTIGLNWFNYKAIYSDTSDTRLLLSIIENDSVNYNQYSILIVPKQEMYFAKNSNNWNFNLIQTAYACSPGIAKTDEKIDSIVIISSKNFDINHPSGTDLADLFNVVVLDHANSIYHDMYKLVEYTKEKPYVPVELTLILREQPDSITDFEFLVKYYQNGIEDNNYFEFLTNKIVITTN